MKQATRSLITLGIIGVIAAGVAAVAWTRSSVEAATSGGPAEKKLFVFEPRDVTAFEITVQGNLARLERQYEGWAATKPVQIGLDEAEVGRLLRALTSMRVHAEFGTEERPEILSDELTGLAAPSTTLVIFAGERTWTLEKGMESSYNRESYFRLTDSDLKERVGTISPSAAAAISRTWRSFRDKRAIGANVDRVLSVRVEPKIATVEKASKAAASIVYELRRLPAEPDVPAYRRVTRFEAIEPPVGIADPQTVGGVFKSLGRAPVSELVTPDHGGDLAKYGLAEPAYKVTMMMVPYAADGEPFERVLRISMPSNGTVLVARDDQPWIGKCAETLTADLALSADQIKSKRLFNFDRLRVARVEMNLKDAGQIVVEREPGGENNWRMLAPVPARAKPHLITSLILSFAELAGESREAEGADAKKTSVLRRTGLLSPQTLRFLDEKGQELGKLLLGKRVEKHAFAMTKNGTYIVRIPVSRLYVLPLKADELIDAR